MSEHVTHAEFNDQLILIHQTMHDNQKDGFAQLHSISKDVSRIAVSVEKLQSEQNVRLDHYDKRLIIVEESTAKNSEKRIESGPWLIMAGVVATAAISAAAAWVFT